MPKKLRILVFLHGTITMPKNATGKTRDEIVGKEGLKADQEIIERYGFPLGKIYHRKQGQSYQEVVESMHPLPDILIEDDCESI